MSAELGLAALWMAAALAALQLACGVLAQREASGELATLVRPAAILQGLLAAFAFRDAAMGFHDYRPVGEACRDEFALDEADGVQAHRSMGQS